MEAAATERGLDYQDRDRTERDGDAEAGGDAGEEGGLQVQAPLPAPTPNRASTASISRRVDSFS
jgi:hypothetical protein